MIYNKRIERERHGPGFFEVTLGVLLGIALGVVIAALHLTFKPVIVVSVPADKPNVGDVYFLQGVRNSDKAPQWRRKLQMLSEGGSADLSLREEELNAWASSAASKVAVKSGVIPALVTPETVNFRIRDGVIQVGVVGKFEALEYSQSLVIQARGKFAPGANGFEFVADELFIGSFPAHVFPGLTQMIIQSAVTAQALPDDLRATWQKLTLIAVEGDSLHIVVP